MIKATNANAIREVITTLPPFGTHEDSADTDIPTIKLFTPDGSGTWFFTEYSADSGLIFGLCDLGMGFPELGYASLEELEGLRGALGLPVEIDLWWENKTMADAKAAINYPY